MEDDLYQTMACSATLPKPNTEHPNISQSRFVLQEENYVQFSNLGSQRTNINLQQPQQMNKKGKFFEIATLVCASCVKSLYDSFFAISSPIVQ